MSASWSVPGDAVSGIYVAKLVREDAGHVGEASHVVFVVRDDTGGSKILFQTSDTTWQAYNQYGGNSLYVGGPGTNPGRAYKVSYNRPITTRGTGAEDSVFNAEYPMVRWLERNGYDVSYSTGVDTDRRGAELLEHQVFLSVGHDEYWSGPQRANVEAARDAGVNLGFFSGNEVFWKTRWEQHRRRTPNARLLQGDARGREDRPGRERVDRHLARPARVQPRGWKARERAHRHDLHRQLLHLRHAGARGRRRSCASGATRASRRSRPGRRRRWVPTRWATSGTRTSTTARARPGLVQLSSATVVDVDQKLQDFGSNYGPGTATHHLTLYRHASGALVFGAGSVQWSWGLDDVHDRGNDPADVRMQQATVNLLADLGVQPTTLQGGLVAATASTDVTPPTTIITAPLNGVSVVGARSL